MRKGEQGCGVRHDLGQVEPGGAGTAEDDLTQRPNRVRPLSGLDQTQIRELAMS